MTSAWDRAKTIADKHAGSLFVRLQNDGDTVIGAFVGEPAARELHWVESKYEECSGPKCARCAVGAKASFRVMFNFFVPAEGAMKIIEGGTTFFGAVLGIREKYSLDGWLFEVKRIGKAKDPKTTYAVLPEKPIDEAMAAAIRAAKPIALEPIGESIGQSIGQSIEKRDDVADDDSDHTPTIPSPPPVHASDPKEPLPF